MTADKYLKILTKQIHDYSIRKDILEEYSQHIEDHINALTASGMARADAEDEAVRQMGDPVAAGRQMNKIYRKFLDWDMALFFAGAGIFIRLIRYVSKESTLPPAASIFIGTFFLLFGLFWSCIEKWLDLPLFYAWAKNWNGGGIVNSGLITAISVYFFPGTWIQSLAYLLSIIIIQLIVRAGISSLHNKKENRLLWMIGTADTEISYKGRGLFQGSYLKVSSMNGIIERGAPIMIVSLDGSKPVVVQLERL